MEETGVQSREIEKHLNTLTGVRQYLKAVKKLMTGQPAQDCQEIVILQAVCELILFGDYIYVANSAAALSMMIREIEEKESNLPAPMQPKVKEIKDYFTKIKARNEKVENLITKVTKRVSRIRR